MFFNLGSAKYLKKNYSFLYHFSLVRYLRKNWTKKVKVKLGKVLYGNLEKFVSAKFLDGNLGSAKCFEGNLGSAKFFWAHIGFRKVFWAYFGFRNLKKVEKHCINRLIPQCFIRDSITRCPLLIKRTVIVMICSMGSEMVSLKQ